jgi:hypothetical protein
MQKVGIFEDEDMEAGTQYYSTTGADMDSRVAAAIFFSAAYGGFAEISHIRGSQHNSVCNHYLREYPGIISRFLSKKEIRVVRHISSVLFNFNRNAKGLRRRYPLRIFSADKKSPD